MFDTYSCTNDLSHRRFVCLGGGEGEAPTAPLAFHQLIVKWTAVADVRDRGESDGFETKNVTRNSVQSSHTWFNKFTDGRFMFKSGVFL